MLPVWRPLPCNVFKLKLIEIADVLSALLLQNALLYSATRKSACVLTLIVWCCVYFTAGSVHKA
jgi:hypothetical protein